MAFCTYCGRDVSPDARACPGCGKPSPAGNDLRYAEWGTRVVAYLLDMLIAWAPLAIAGVMLFATGATSVSTVEDENGTRIVDFNPGSGRLYVGVVVVGLVFGVVWALLYKPMFEGRTGQTWAKRWLKIRVVREDGSALTYGPAFARWVVSWVINAVPFGGLVDDLWPLWDDRNQALHDKAAKTLVVRAV